MIQYSQDIISQYSSEFHRELFRIILGISHGNVQWIFHKHIFAWWVFTILIMEVNAKNFFPNNKMELLSNANCNDTHITCMCQVLDVLCIGTGSGNVLIYDFDTSSGHWHIWILPVIYSRNLTAMFSTSVRTIWNWTSSDCIFLSCNVRILEWIHTQGTPCSKQPRYLNFKWLQQDSNPEPLSL